LAPSVKGADEHSSFLTTKTLPSNFSAALTFAVLSFGRSRKATLS
jgi:hypothetical protein